MAEDLEKLAQKIAQAARRGVQIERMWHEKLKADQERKQATNPK